MMNRIEILVAFFAICALYLLTQGCSTVADIAACTMAVCN
jgi:hypothetical protein